MPSSLILHQSRERKACSTFVDSTSRAGIEMRSRCKLGPTFSLGFGVGKRAEAKHLASDKVP